MAGVGGAAFVPTFSYCRCSDPQSSSVSGVPALFSPFNHLIRLPRKSRLVRELSRSSRSSISEVSLRILKARTSSWQSSSTSHLCTLSTLSSLDNSAVAEDVAVEHVSSFLLRNLGAFWTGSLVFGTAGAALAESIDLPTAPSANEGTPTDYLLSFLLITAFIGLAVLTIGVGYLGVSDFLENRQRKATQEAAGEEKSGKGNKGDKDDAVRVGAGKGFGVKKVVEKKTEKSK